MCSTRRSARSKGPGAPSYTSAFTEAIVKEGEARPELIAITAAMPGSTGLLPFEERFPERFVDVGIAEQHAVTSAAGMAMGGLRPVVALYSTFLSRAFDQANLDVGLHHLPVVFCLDRAGITGDDGPSHHGILDMVLLSKVPGITMFAPSSYQELQVQLHDALDLCDGPVSLRGTAAPVVEEGGVGHGLSMQSAPVATSAHRRRPFGHAWRRRAAGAEGIETVWDPVIKPLDRTCSPARRRSTSSSVGRPARNSISHRQEVAARTVGTGRNPDLGQRRAHRVPGGKRHLGQPRPRRRRHRPHHPHPARLRCPACSA